MNIFIPFPTKTPFNKYSGSETHIRIDPDVTALPDRAFYNNDKLVEVEGSAGPVLIGKGAFFGCESLEEINLRESSGLRTIGPYAFLGCKSLKRVILPPSTVSEIDDYAFHDCPSLEEINLGDCEGLRSISYRSFQGCKSLIRINHPSTIESIYGGAFSGCTWLEEVHLCEGLRSIENGAFSNCISLKKVSIPSSVREICSHAFTGCSELKEVDLKEASGTCTIRIFAFHDCVSLLHINIPSAVTFEIPDDQDEENDENEVEEGVFTTCSLLRNVATSPWSSLENEAFLREFPIFRKLNLTIDDIKHRFDNLPLHELCFYHSPQTMQCINQWTPANLSKVDCLGMTPLHVLTCSGKHDLGLYRRIIEMCPTALFAKDKWGEIPLAYIILSGAPEEVLHFFLEMHQKDGVMPLDYSKMIKSIAVFSKGTYITQVIQAQRTYFPDLKIDWRNIRKIFAKRFCSSFCKQFAGY